MSNWEAKWSGKYPNLCCGEWTLYQDGRLVNVEIPFQKTIANTFGRYPQWTFDQNYYEHWYCLDDGLKFEDWKNCYWSFLNEVTQDKEEWEKIYLAFAANDWRHGCCGGCI